MTVICLLYLVYYCSQRRNREKTVSQNSQCEIRIVRSLECSKSLYSIFQYRILDISIFSHYIETISDRMLRKRLVLRRHL